VGKIETRYKGDMLFETTIGAHTLVIDVPAGMGGHDRGPTPPELFIASLGSCVGAFVAQYCERNGVDTTDMAVDVTFDKAEEPTRLQNIKATVRMPHGSCGARRAAVLRVAEHCPVHETISTMKGIELELLGKEELVGAG
jgi:uncharacterized OsmC-like protein